MSKEIFLFGYSAQGQVLAKSLSKERYRLYIIESDASLLEKATKDGYLDTMLVDVMDDAAIETLHINDESLIVCVMKDEHLNVYVTLSLRALYPSVSILALSNSIYTTQKLKMAGANRVIDTYKVSAYRIHNILRRPVATKLLDSFISDSSPISFAEILIPENSFLDAKMIGDIDFNSFGILIIGMQDAEPGSQFKFVTIGVEQRLTCGDTLVCMGYDEDLERFKKLITKMEMP